MKKVLITAILIFIILISFLATNVYAVTVTNDSLYKSLKGIVTNQTIENDTVSNKFLFKDTKTTVHCYSLNDYPTFTIYLDFNNEMSEKECLNEYKKILTIGSMFGAVADHFSIDVKDSVYYFASFFTDSKMEELFATSIKNFKNGVEFARDKFDSNINIADEKIFKLITTKVSDVGDAYVGKVMLQVDLKSDFSVMKGYYEKIDGDISDSILDAAQNAADKYGETSKNEQAELNKYEASLQGKTLVEKFKEKLDVYKDSVQIDNELYLKYSSAEKSDIYKLMTSNAQKIFEKNANYFKKSNAYYYDTGRLRTLPIIYYTDVLVSELELKSATENEATFDVLTKNIVSGDAVETYKNGLKIVKKDGEWLIDSLKFKSTVEEFDYYPEFVEIEKEETSKPEDKENIKDETVNNEKVDNETVENEIVMPDNNIIDTNNQTNISNETIGAITTEKGNENIIKVEYILYIVSGVLGLALAFIVYKVFIYSKDSNEEK